jgi:hypothetical protein
MTANSLINPHGDFCTGCGQQFIRNLVGFDVLPLVEFAPKPQIPIGRVMDSLRSDPPDEGIKQAPRQGNHWQYNPNGDE